MMPKEVVKEKFIGRMQKLALYYGAGGLTCLQLLKLDLFSFPPGAAIYLGYFFSLVVLFSVFFGGSAVVEMIRKISGLMKQMNELKKDTPAEEV